MGINKSHLEFMFIYWISLSHRNWWKGHTDRDFIFEEKRQEALEKKIGCKFIRINTSKEGYDADYEASRIKTFISKFKDRQLKKLNKN